MQAYENSTRMLIIVFYLVKWEILEFCNEVHGSDWFSHTKKVMQSFLEPYTGKQTSLNQSS